MKRARAAVLLPLAVLAGCGSGGSRHPASHPPPQKQRGLQAALPSGFQNGAGGRAPGVLSVSPAIGMHASDVHLAPVPGEAEIRRALASVLGEPVPVLARRIFVSSDVVKPGQRIAVAAAHLGAAPSHAALFILQTPGFRVEHLVAVANQVAAGYVTLPARMAPGTWYIAAEDTSTVRRLPSGALSGTALVDIGILHVRR